MQSIVGTIERTRELERTKALEQYKVLERSKAPEQAKTLVQEERAKKRPKRAFEMSR